LLFRLYVCVVVFLCRAFFYSRRTVCVAATTSIHLTTWTNARTTPTLSAGRWTGLPLLDVLLAAVSAFGWMPPRARNLLPLPLPLWCRFRADVWDMKTGTGLRRFGCYRCPSYRLPPLYHHSYMSNLALPGALRALRTDRRERRRAGITVGSPHAHGCAAATLSVLLLRGSARGRTVATTWRGAAAAPADAVLDDMVTLFVF